MHNIKFIVVKRKMKCSNENKIIVIIWNNGHIIAFIGWASAEYVVHILYKKKLRHVTQCSWVFFLKRSFLQGAFTDFFIFPDFVLLS